MQEIYYLTKYTNNSVGDVKELTPHERMLFLQFLVDEAKKNEKLLENQLKEAKKNKSSR